MSEVRVCSGKNRLIQLAQPRRNGWTIEKRERFLDALAQSCNVQLSARCAGMSGSSPYNLRRRDATFAAQWDEALETACKRLEAELMAHSIAAAAGSAASLLPRTGDAAEAEDDGACADAPARRLTGDDIRLSMFLLTRHEAKAGGGRGRSGPARRPTREETNALLKKKLDLIDRQMQAAGRRDGGRPDGGGPGGGRPDGE